MKVFTLRQPWAGAVFHGKDVENRPGMFGHRGLVAIHAGQALGDLQAFTTVQDLGVDLPVLGAPLSPVEWQLGALVGVVDIVSAHRSAVCDGRCSPWAQAGCAHHRLANPRVLTRPVPAYGKQGMWSLPGDIEAEVWKAMPR